MGGVTVVVGEVAASGRAGACGPSRTTVTTLAFPTGNEGVDGFGPARGEVDRSPRPRRSSALARRFMTALEERVGWPAGERSSVWLLWRVPVAEGAAVVGFDGMDDDDDDEGTAAESISVAPVADLVASAMPVGLPTGGSPPWAGETKGDDMVR